MKKILIYGLVSSENIDVIKYVGKTNQKINKRINDHIRESYKLKTKKDKWVQSVINSGYSIKYQIIEECDESNWLIREKYWISKINDLTNISKGGDGGRALVATKTFEELCEFSHKNMVNVKNSIEWVKFVINNPQYKFLPKYPQASYKNRGWTSWGELLVNYSGTDSNKRNCYRLILTYNECKKYLKVFNLKNNKEFKKIIKTLTIKIPSAPYEYYKKNNTWVSWGDFLSNDNIYHKNKEFLTYYEAKKILKPFNFRSKNQYREFIKKTKYYFPFDPDRFYKNNWGGWCDFLSKKTH